MVSYLIFDRNVTQIIVGTDNAKEGRSHEWTVENTDAKDETIDLVRRSRKEGLLKHGQLSPGRCGADTSPSAPSFPLSQ